MPKGKGLLAILGDAKSAPEGDEDAEMGGEAKRQAARSLREALKGDDDAAIASAFQRMVDMCASDGGSEDYDEDGE